MKVTKGYKNSGDYNTGDYNSGYFNVDRPKTRIFGKETDKDVSDVMNEIYLELLPLEKGKNAYKKMWVKSWEKTFSDDLKEKIKRLPNFDAAIFYEITGVKI